MKKGKSSLSAADSYKGIGEFWDDHDLADCWDQTSAASFEVEIGSDTTYYAVEKKLAAEIQALASRRGVTTDTLLNLWLQEKLHEQKAA